VLKCAHFSPKIKCVLRVRDNYGKCWLACWSVAFVCHDVCACVCLFPPYRSQFKSNLYQTSHTGRHGEELITFSRSWDRGQGHEATIVEISASPRSVSCVLILSVLCFTAYHLVLSTPWREIAVCFLSTKWRVVSVESR